MDTAVEGLLVGWQAHGDAHDGGGAHALASALEEHSQDREAVLERALATAPRPEDLNSLAWAVFYQAWPGCESAAARLFLEARRRGGPVEETIKGMRAALPYISEQASIEDLVRQTVLLSERHPSALLLAAAHAARSSQPDEGQRFALEALDLLITRFGTSPGESPSIREFGDALKLIDDRTAEEVATRALDSTNRDPRVLVEWIDRLTSADLDRARELALEAADDVTERIKLEADHPFDTDALSRLLEVLDEYGIDKVLVRARNALDNASPEAFLRFATALANATRTRPDLAEPAAEFLISALRRGASTGEVADHLALVSQQLREPERKRILEAAMQSSDRAPAILSLWARFLLARAQEHWLAGDDLEQLTRATYEYARVEGRSPVSVLDVLSEFSVRRWHGAVEEWLAMMDAALPDDVELSVAKACHQVQLERWDLAVHDLRETLFSDHEDDELRQTCLQYWLHCHRNLGTLAEARTELENLADQTPLWVSPARGAYQIGLAHLRASLLMADHMAATTDLAAFKAHIDQGFPAPEAEAACNAASRGRSGWLRTQTRDPALLHQAAFWTERPEHKLLLQELAVERLEQTPYAATAQLRFEQGLSLADLRHHQEAIDAYEESIAAWNQPQRGDDYWLNGPYARHNIAVALENLGSYAEASAQWRTAARAYAPYSEARDPNAYWAHASALLRIDELVDAYHACHAGLAVAPDHVDLLRAMVEIERKWRLTLARRIVEQAEKSPDQVLRRLPTSATWQAHDSARRLNAALSRRAAGSRNVDHLREYAEFLMGREDHKTATRVLDKAVEIDPENGAVLEAIGRLHHAQGQFEEALGAFTRAQEYKPGDHELRSRMGHTLAKLGRRDAAFAALHEVRATAPEHLPTLIRLADLYVDQGDELQESGPYEKAVELYERVLRLHVSGAGSKHLTSQELADIHYQCGYSLVALYVKRVGSSTGQRKRAQLHFVECLKVDAYHEKALIAHRRVGDRDASQSMKAREKLGPWLIVAPMLFVFGLAQFRHFQSTIDEASYLALTFGSVVLAIAGLFLPELLKLKVGGVELEKSPVEQQREPEHLQLSR